MSLAWAINTDVKAKWQREDNHDLWITAINQEDGKTIDLGQSHQGYGCRNQQRKPLSQNVGWKLVANGRDTAYKTFCKQV